MGFYINPVDQSKEAWLAEYGHRATPDALKADFGSWQNGNNDKGKEGEPMLPVCLVDNGAFTAAGVAYSPEELAVFLHPDGRPRKWYLVPISSLIGVGALPKWPCP